jgi:NAD(P)-dependent dehydrogenase (short-subunit alcohol dehydrogenase family)
LPKARSATNSLKGKTALITGATQGIGLAIARSLAAEGCNLIICGRNESRLSKVAAELSRQKIRALAIKCDVRDEQSVINMIAAIRKKFGNLDILVNNAGIAHASRPVSRLSPRDWNDVIATNLTGMFLVTHAALPLMKRGSVIANNLSIAAKRVFPGSAAYNASKHGALGFTSTLREELRQQGIRVIALLPGATDTAIWDTLWPTAPRKKMISPETVAQALVNALKLPENTAMEEMEILPAAGTHFQR